VLEHRTRPDHIAYMEATWLELKDTASTQHSAVSRGRRTNPNRKTQTRKSSKARRRGRRGDDSGRVTTFPEVKGKVVREVRFSHHDSDNVLAIAFKDRTVLVFEVDPTPLVLPVEIRAQYIGERRSAAKTWERLAGRANSN
jgi:hypothetical protein